MEKLPHTWRSELTAYLSREPEVSRIRSEYARIGLLGYPAKNMTEQLAMDLLTADFQLQRLVDDWREAHPDSESDVVFAAFWDAVDGAWLDPSITERAEELQPSGANGEGHDELSVALAYGGWPLPWERAR